MALEMDKNRAYISHTPHKTLRVFVPKSSIEEHAQLVVLNTLSIWGGCDSHDEIHLSWEFDSTFTPSGLHAILMRVFKKQFIHPLAIEIL